MLQPDTKRANVVLRTITSALTANTSGALNIAPKMNPTVRLPVKNDAIMPTASMAMPTNQ